MYIELIGYIAMLLVAISFLMSIHEGACRRWEDLWKLAGKRWEVAN